MRPLLRFAPRIQTEPAPTSTTKQTAASLIDHIQVLVLTDNDIALRVMNAYACKQRRHALEEDEEQQDGSV